MLLLGYATTPTGRFQHEVVEIAGRYSGNARRLGERSGAHAIELLPCFCGECAQLEVRHVGRERERRQLSQARRGVPLAREVAVVLDLDLGGENGVRRRITGDSSCSEQRAERSEEHTSELQSRRDLVCRLLLEKQKNT